MRKQPSFRKKFIIIWKLLLHFVQVSCQIVFTSNLIHAWEMINLLKWLHVFPFFQARGNVCPLNVPLDVGVPRVLMTKFPVKIFLADVFDNVILSIEYIKHDSQWLGLRYYFYYFLFLLLLLFFLYWLFGRLLLLSLLRNYNQIVFAVNFCPSRLK